VDNERIVERVVSDDGVSRLRPGQHRDVFLRQCGAWLAREPHLPVFLVGMVGSREGWAVAPYVTCPADVHQIAGGMIAVEAVDNRAAYIVPGLFCEPATTAADVLRGEETLVLGVGVENGLICLPGTHSKWVLMFGGRIVRFATYITGEMYALLRKHSMIGRPASEPSDPAGFELGLGAAMRNSGESLTRRVGLLHLLFGARAAVVSDHMPAELLGPYLSGLLTGDEVNGALSQFPHSSSVTIVASSPRADLYAEALRRRGIDTEVFRPEEALIKGISRIIAART
jgi:2-dehydro-3-deoxygalactonokinase